MPVNTDLARGRGTDERWPYPTTHRGFLFPFVAASLAVAALLGACTPLLPSRSETQSTYLLDALPSRVAQTSQRDLVLLVGLPRARPGFDAEGIAYVRRPHEVEYFASSRWTKPPAQMLQPLMAETLQRAGRFRAVVPAPSTAVAHLRLDTELIRLQQDFTERPSRVQLALQVRLVEVDTRRVLATREFDETQVAASDDPYGGVVAANQALVRVLERLAAFCIEETEGL